MNHARLFEELLLELQTLINSDAEYDLIKSSRILRQLLLDGDALLHIVNREIRISPRFRILHTQANGDHFVPEIYPGDIETTSVTINVQQFLSHPMGEFSERRITVRDIIKFAAIALGGVHFKDDKRGEFSQLSALHASQAVSPVLLALKHIGAITRDALIPIRDQLLERERFEQGKGWTSILSLRLLPVPADEENYILDLGANEHRDRFSIYVDTRGELTFRTIDAAGGRRYLRAGRVGLAVPLESPIILVCEMSTVGDETLLAIRTDGWDHAEVVPASSFGEIGDPFHFVTGSDCVGRKHTHMDQFGTLLIARPLSRLETAQAVAYFSAKAASAEHWVNFSGNQFLHSRAHPNFTADGA